MASTQQHVLPLVQSWPVPPFVLSEPSEGSRRLRVGVVVTSVVVMLVVGLWGLDRGSMWLDEAVTFTMVTRPVHEIVSVLRNIDAVHGAYYVFEHFWMRFGGGEMWMRVPSVLAMGVAAGATAALGSRLAGARTGLVAGLLFAGWPLISYYAQEGRSYALVTAAVLVATYCLVQALSARRLRWWWGYAVSLVVAATLHEFAVLAVLAHGVLVLLVRPGWRVWRWWLASVLACAVLIAPIVRRSLQQSNQLNHVKPTTSSTLQLLADRFLGSSPWLSAFVVGLAVLGVVAEMRRWRRREGGGLVAVALPLLLVPVVALLTVSLVQPLFEVRYVLFCVAGLPLLAARGVEQLAAVAVRVTSRNAVGWAVAGLLVAAVSVAQLPDLHHERTVKSRSQDLSGAAAVVRAHAQPGDAVIFIPPTLRVGAMAYPDGFRQVDDVALHRSATQAANLRGTNRTPPAVRDAMLSRQRIWVIGFKSRMRITDGTAPAEMAVLREHFMQERRYPAHGVEVALYVRKNM